MEKRMKIMMSIRWLWKIVEFFQWRRHDYLPNHAGGKYARREYHE